MGTYSVPRLASLVTVTRVVDQVLQATENENVDLSSQEGGFAVFAGIHASAVVLVVPDAGLESDAPVLASDLAALLKQQVVPHSRFALELMEHKKPS